MGPVRFCVDRLIDAYVGPEVDVFGAGFNITSGVDSVGVLSGGTGVCRIGMILSVKFYLCVIIGIGQISRTNSMFFTVSMGVLPCRRHPMRM